MYSRLVHIEEELQQAGLLAYNTHIFRTPNAEAEPDELNEGEESEQASQDAH